MKRGTFVTCISSFSILQILDFTKQFSQYLAVTLLNRGSTVYRLEIYYKMDEVCSQDLSGKEHTVRHQLSSY